MKKYSDISGTGGCEPRNYNSPSDHFDMDDFKCELNTFMIQHAPGHLTINTIEALMAKFCDSVAKAALDAGDES